jgi:hypothetical protein
MNRDSYWLVSVCAVCVLLSSCSSRTPSHYMLKDGFVGWVRIDFNVADAVATAKESGVYIVRLDSDGRASTLSNPFDLLAQHRFFVEGKNGTKIELKESFWNGRAEFKDTDPEQQARVWGRGIITEKNAGRERVYERFFVGTKMQFADSSRGWTR